MKSSAGNWILENKFMHVEIDGATGALCSFCLRKKKFEMIPPGGCGALQVYDELKECAYPAAPRPVRKLAGTIGRKADMQRLVLKKEFAGADFRMEETFSLFKDRLHWSARIIKTHGGDRSLKICFNVPFPLNRKSITAPLIEKRPWHVWAPISGAPFTADTNYLRYSYHDENNRPDDASLPALVIYNPAADVGISFIKPFEDYTPKMVFDHDCRNGLVSIAHEYMALRGDHAPYVALNIVPHAGCYRAALAWMLKTYRQYFIPPNAKIFDQEGVMYYGVEEVPEKYISAWKKAFNLKWEEIQQATNTAHAGQWVPDKPSWTFDCWIKFRRFKPIHGITHARVNNYLKMLKKHEVAGFIYFDIGDYIPPNDDFPKRYGNAFARSAKNEIMSINPGWAPSTVYRMDPDPDLGYGREMERQLKMLRTRFPQAAGIFFDQALYRDFNYHRDDGLTMINNVPCCNTAISYQKFLKRMRKILDKDGLTVFANNPTQIERARYFDGVMAEGDRDYLAYLCLTKPLVTISGRDEKALQWCLKWGAFPHIPPILYEGSHLKEYVPNKPRAKDVVLYKRYYQIIKYFYARTWVLEPYALNLPPELDGNIFKTRDGDYLITLIPNVRRISKRKILITVKLKEAPSIKKARLITVDKTGAREVEFAKTNDNTIIVAMNSPVQFSAAAVILCK